MKKFFILFAVVALIAGFTVNSFADADIYASMRFATAWNSLSEERTAQMTDDDGDLVWGLQANSRLGAKFSAGDISGKYEVGLRGSNDGRDPNGVYTRQLYGAWNFGSGELLIGQTYTPFFKPYGNECCDDDFALLSHGEMYDSRNPMIQLKFDALKIAFISPKTDLNYVGNEDSDTTIPKIALSYSIPLDTITFDFWGGYNTYEMNTENIDSYAVGAGIMTNFDALYVNAKIWTAANAANYGMATDSAFDGAYIDPITGDVEDADTLAGVLVAGFRASEKVTYEGGIGYQQSERYMSEEDAVTMYYLNAKIDIVKNFFILPEIAYFDYDDSTSAAGVDTPMGDRTVALIKWQIDL